MFRQVEETMASQSCSSIRTALLEYFGEQTEVLSLGNTCVISLPIKTVDNRWVEVHVEERMDGFYVVHDAGKTSGELISHGVKMTSGQITIMNQIAGSLGASVHDDGTFILGCKKKEDLEKAILAVAQCASLGMLEVMKHRPVVEDEPIIRLAGEVISEWSDGKGKIRSRVAIHGDSAQHKMDFVFFPQDNDPRRTIAVSILNPRYTAMIAAKLYGFMAVDIDKVPTYRNWKRLAILSRKNQWTQDAVDLIEKHAARVVQVGASSSSVDLKAPLIEAMDYIKEAA